MTAQIKVPLYTLKRLPHYYRLVSEYFEKEIETVSSEEIARAVQVNAVQVRRDLMLFGAMGTPGVGYNVKALKLELEELLGLNNNNEAVLVGVGRLGRAIADYSGFARYGLNIVALFDADPRIIGSKIAKREVFAVEELEHIIKRIGVKVGIIAVPVEWAQSVADSLVKAGVKAIWNFAPTTLSVPEEVVVKNEDLAAGLATLFHFVRDKDAHQLSMIE